MALRKRLLSSGAACALTGLLLRVYRAVHFAWVLVRVDPALVRLVRSRRPAIFACWHQDFPYTMGWLSRFSARRRTYVLASASRDGALAAAAAAAVGLRPAARGSSARGGARALLSLHRLGRRGDGSLAVVCDGPRPPARVLQPGVVHLARDTGLEVWLLRSAYRPRALLRRTWARFLAVPPGARGVVVADGPIRVRPDLDRAGLEAVRREVEQRLNRLADRADRVVGNPREGHLQPSGTVPPLG
jgi:lysophospholipid acyltransferase (LPLAT)-like uncharacterized protein